MNPDVPPLSLAQLPNDSLQDYFTQAGLAHRSQLAVRRDVKHFVTQAQALGLTHLLQVHTNHLQWLVQQQAESGKAPATVRRWFSSVKQLLHWCYEQGYLLDEPYTNVRLPKLPKRLPKSLPQPWLEQALQTPTASDGQKNQLAIRDHAMFEVLYSAGLRVGELVQLDASQLATDPTQLVVTGKGNRQRVVFLGQEAQTALSRWLPIRQQWLNKQQMLTQTALFIGQGATRLTPRSVEYRVKLWSTRHGLDVHPHQFRHACATHLLNNSGNIRAVQELLGHQSLKATQVYTSLEFSALAKTYRQAHPRAIHETENPMSQSSSE